MTIASDTLSQLAAIYHAPQTVVAAIQNAAQKTGVDFGYLLTKAQTESNFNSNATSSSSSATGLYQFTDKTWLQMVKEYGSGCGLGQYAGAINSDCEVSNAATRRQILSLRKDPTISAYMAAQYAKQNQQQLEANTDVKIGKTELYMAHFLGAGGASKFLNAYEKIQTRKPPIFYQPRPTLTPACFIIRMAMRLRSNKFIIILRANLMRPARCWTLPRTKPCPHRPRWRLPR